MLTGRTPRREVLFARLANRLEMNVQQTPLSTLHQSLGAVMVPFADYLLPLRYGGGILREHSHTRKAAGLFDVSHMGLVEIEGASGWYGRLESLLPSDLKGLPAGAGKYSLLLNDQGGVIDDLVLMRPADDLAQRRLLLVVNAANKQLVVEHLRQGLQGEASVKLLVGRALLALQGPSAARVLGRLCPDAERLGFMQCGQFDVQGYGSLMISRSGYTGEDGFEIALSAGCSENFARALLDDPEVQMCGLGARDSLRLEAGLPLYGHDLDGGTTICQAGLAWVVGRRRREQGGFPGFAIFHRELVEGPARLRVGIQPEGKIIVREGVAILADGKRVGTVGSGGFGPTVQGPIAMAYVEATHATPGSPLSLVVRGKPHPGKVVPLPFVPHRYFRQPRG